MKKLNLSLVTILAMSTFAIAGGDIDPIEEPEIMVEGPIMVAPTTGGFYLGVAYGYMTADSIDTYNSRIGHVEKTLLDEDFSEIMLQAGYKFNDYIALEGRYWFGLDTGINLIDDITGNTLGLDQSVDSWGIYIKPIYPITETFDIYALLGYADSEYDLSNFRGNIRPDVDLDGFSWGIGAAYNVSENVSLFIDYVSLYDDDTKYRTELDLAGSIDDELRTWNFGATYQF